MDEMNCLIGTVTPMGALTNLYCLLVQFSASGSCGQVFGSQFRTQTFKSDE